MGGGGGMSGAGKSTEASFATGHACYFVGIGGRWRKKWFKSSDKSPKTGVSIENKLLIPNFSIKNLIHEWKEKHSVRL